MPKPQATDEQVETFSYAIAITAERPENHQASVVGQMDEDGTMLVSMTEDGATTHARFGTDGRIIGDWF